MRAIYSLLISCLLAACGGGGSTNAAVPTPTSTPTAENRAPVITSFGALGAIGGTSALGSISATDADADTLSFSIVSGDDQGLFALTTDGVLSSMK